MTKKYLIALDLDGTVLYDFDSISQTLCRYIKEIQEQGHKVVIATGRPFRSSKFIYDSFSLDTPIINYNGSLIQNPSDPSFKKVDHRIDKSIIIDIFDKNKEYIRNAFSELNDDIYLYREEKAIEPLLHADHATNITVGDFKDNLKEDINGMIIIGKQGTGKTIKSYVDNNFKGKICARIWQLSGEYDSILEIYNPGVNKGTALKIVADNLGFKPKDVIAIGDGHNDIEMFRFAGKSIAMKDAHEDLKKVADIILEHTSREDAVFRFLSDFLESSRG
ncbi:MAG: Cof-type HAD-IIB family hydrolase [Candidatus Izimaplasma sp.]|nr:Cof-type HAD-IIB family hydrolase [Candidatus Izimaplasma bacterium]